MRRRGPTIRAAAAAVLAAAGMLLLMVGQPRFETGRGGGVSAGGGLVGAPRTPEGLRPYGVAAALALAVAAGAWVLGYLTRRWGLAWRQRRSGEPEVVYVMERPPAPWWLPLVLGAVVAGAVGGLYAAFSSRWAAGLEAIAVLRPSASLWVWPAAGGHAPATPQADEALRGLAGGSGARLGDALRWLLAMLATATAAVPVAEALRRRKTAPQPPGGAEVSVWPAFDPSRHPAALGREDFERRVTAIAAMADPRQAVGAAFQLFVEASTAPGKAPEAALTPFERVARAVPEALGRSPQAQRLLQLYHEAAYGPRETTAAEQAEAVAALRELWPWLEKVRPCPR